MSVKLLLHVWYYSEGARYYVETKRRKFETSGARKMLTELRNRDKLEKLEQVMRIQPQNEVVFGNV